MSRSEHRRTEHGLMKHRMCGHAGPAGEREPSPVLRRWLRRCMRSGQQRCVISGIVVALSDVTPIPDIAQGNNHVGVTSISGIGVTNDLPGCIAPHRLRQVCARDGRQTRRQPIVLAPMSATPKAACLSL